MLQREATKPNLPMLLFKQHVATPHIARVSGDAVSGLAALFKLVVLQLVNGGVREGQEPIKMKSPTLESLEHWYVAIVTCAVPITITILGFEISGQERVRKPRSWSVRQP